MSETVWQSGKDPTAMLHLLGTVSERKQRLVSAALIRRLGCYLRPPVYAIIENLESDLPNLKEAAALLENEIRAFEQRRQRTFGLVALDRSDHAAASEGQNVTYAAEVPHAAAAMLGENAIAARASAEQSAYDAIRNVFASDSIHETARLILDANLSEGRAIVFVAVAESWRQYADQIAERTANQPRKRKLLISDAVRYIQRGRDGLESKENRKVREIEMGETAAFALILREIFGNPFRPVTLDPRWQISTVVDLAQAIYDDSPRQAGGYDHMPILADALMDAGCDSEDIIQHCRGPGPHVKGCWVVDLLLGKT